MISPKLRAAFLDRYPARTPAAKSFRLQESFRPARAPDQVFESGLVVTTNVVFVDICGSAMRTATMAPHEVREFLDEYYSVVVPEIYDRGGEIDKLLGDGVIAVFGPPFPGFGPQALTAGLAAALDFGRSVVQRLAYSPLEVKVAVRQGDLCFTVIGDEHYRESTIVGSTLTELHALESVSVNRGVNLVAGTVEHAFASQGRSYAITAASYPFWRRTTREVEVAGHDFGRTYVEEWVDPTRGRA